MKQNYDYKKALKKDILRYLLFNNIKLTRYNYKEVFVEMLMADCVTGIKTSSYTFDFEVAKNNICCNIELCQEACNNLAISSGLYNELIASEEFEYLDCVIRCYLLVIMLPQFIIEREEIENEK